MTDLQRIIQEGRLQLTAVPSLYRSQPIWSWREQPIGDYALILTLEGRGQICVNDAIHPLRRGVCLFLQPNSRLEAHQTPSYPLFLFIARFRVSEADSGGKAAPVQSIFIRNTRSMETLAELIAGRNGAGDSRRPLVAEATGLLIRLLVEEAACHTGRFDPKAYEALRAIENDLARKWTVSELAQEAGLTTGAFARAFRRMLNEPPIHYVIRRRMEEAKRQIQQSSLPIDEIAINLGYSDLNLFRDLFRKRTGRGPEEMRSSRPF